MPGGAMMAHDKHGAQRNTVELALFCLQLSLLGLVSDVLLQM